MFIGKLVVAFIYAFMNLIDKLDLIRAVSIDTRATKQLLTPNSVPGFLSHCPLPDYGPVTYKL